MATLHASRSPVEHAREHPAPYAPASTQYRFMLYSRFFSMLFASAQILLTQSTTMPPMDIVI